MIKKIKTLISKGLIKKEQEKPSGGDSGLNTQIQLLEEYFDEEFYLLENKDIDPSEVSPLEHYVLFGWREGRWPTPYFNPEAYLKAYPDVENRGIEPFGHYLRFGKYEGRDPNPPVKDDISLDLGESELEKNNIEIESEKESVISNFNSEKGATLEKINIDRNLVSEWFDHEFYLSRYSDLDPSSVDPFEHYCAFGWREGRIPSHEFDTDSYMKLYKREIPEGTEPITFYMTTGKARGHAIPSAPWYDEMGLLHAGKWEQGYLCEDSSIREFRLNDWFPDERLGGGHYGRMDLHWFIPDFAEGSGGHMTIFRMISWLELMGHDCTIWIVNPTMHETGEDAYETIIKFFQTIRSPVHIASDSLLPTSGDVYIATAWQTVAWMLRSEGARSRAYFVQDFEPYFYPLGSHYLLAEQTYRAGLPAICASPWLEQIMREQYGCWARSFMLAYDERYYFPPQRDFKESRKREKEVKIAVYARHFSARRAVELALAGIDRLSEQGYNIEVHLFGAELGIKHAPIDVVEHGIVGPDALGKLYRACDVGVCFSATNYSLVPQEMMACELPVVDLDLESARSVFPEGVLQLAEPNPDGVAAAISSLIDDETYRAEVGRAGYNWAAKFTWRGAAEQVRISLEEIAFGKSTANSSQLVNKDYDSPKASVLIPTRNAGDFLDPLLAALEEQEVPWAFEVICIDTESTDGTFERLLEVDWVKVFQIEKKDFQHGKTRNLLASYAQGDYLVFLTQDAIPADQYWLYNLVTVLEHYPDAGGAVCRQVAHDWASQFTRAELDAHFDGLLSKPVKITPEMASGFEELQWQQISHFFSNSASGIKREAWEQVPFPEVKYGEDQLWAARALDAGYSKIHAFNSVVKHSHEYDVQNAYERAKVEADFFQFYFGYRLVNIDNTEGIADELMEGARSEGKRMSLSENEIQQRAEVLRARVLGWADGILEKPSLFEQNNDKKSPF